MVKDPDTRADAGRVRDGRIFTRRRAFTPLTLLVAALDLAAIVAAALLWWVADAERHGQDMPWTFGGLVIAAAAGLLWWAVSAGRDRVALALSTFLLIAAVAVSLFG